MQGRAGYVNQGIHVVRDYASQPLFSNVNENKLKNATTISRKCLCRRQTNPLRVEIQLADYNNKLNYNIINNLCVCRVHQTPGQL